MKLNKKRYRELIKDSQKLDQHEKHLSDISEGFVIYEKLFTINDTIKLQYI